MQNGVEHYSVNHIIKRLKMDFFIFFEQIRLKYNCSFSFVAPSHLIFCILRFIVLTFDI